MTLPKLIVLGDSPREPEEQIDLNIHPRSMEYVFNLLTLPR